LSSHPDSKFQNLLEFFRKIVPSIVVTEFVSRKIIFYSVRSAFGVRKNVVRVPIGFPDNSSADVTSTTSLAKNLQALILGESLSGKGF